MFPPDPNLEWLGHVQPVGLVVAPSVLARHGLVPEQQTRLDSEEVAPFLSQEEEGPAVADPWGFLVRVLSWRAPQVAGAQGGPALPEDLSVWLPESETRLAPDLAVTAPSGGWQLLVQFAAHGINPDARGALAGWEATPHQRLERLLRETGVPTGLLISDHELRLVHAPRGETSGWLAFPLRALGSVSGRPMLGGLRLLLSAFRLHNDAAERRLPALLKASRDAQAEVSTKLASQVLGALHELLRGLHDADRARIEPLAAQQSAHLYEGLLTVLLRLVFLLYAEDRNLVPSAAGAEARALYENGYGVRALYARLLEDEARQPDTMEERRGAWSRLLALFRLIYAGHPSGWIRGRGGKLFDPAVFPFLQGQDAATDRAAPAPVSDGCVLRVLDGLLNLDGERLSYRTLDVEQIGSVYETVMGFTALTLPGPALAIKAGKNNRTPVFLDLAALAVKNGVDRQKFLREEADRGQLPAKVAQALSAARDAPAIAEALRPIVDERGSPGGRLADAGTPLLQPTDERRRTGSHYTPRSLTEPIVRHALEPAFERIGDAATPAEVLTLKVWDPAMGSGAFLVEACRQLATRLVMAWVRHPGTRPEIAPDEDEDLLARRLVAQRCLYGVDRNHLATDLARLSLWLATLARDHEFTFLDHALKTGDSLVGLTRAQIGALTWGDDRQGSLFTRFVAGRVAEAVQARTDIREAADDVARGIQEAKHATLEARLADVRALGDAVLAAFFAHDKPRAREAERQALEDLGGQDMATFWAQVRRQAATLGQGPHPLRPFHWEVEFPEVFASATPGFDAIVGNPPFLGGKRISAVYSETYNEWVSSLHGGTSKNADIVAHFFRRAFALIRSEGSFGLIGTNTVGQGSSRESGLACILRADGVVRRAISRLPWPGEAAVVVSVVHVIKGISNTAILNGRQVRRISAYLVEGELDASPSVLVQNSGKAFQGCILRGMGFTFDDAGRASVVTPLAEMERLIALNPRNAERIRPYIGGEEVNNDPRHAHRRYVIDFSGLEETEAWAGWPDLMSIINSKVKPERNIIKNEKVKQNWWRWEYEGNEIKAKSANLKRILVINCGATPHASFTFLTTGMAYANTLAVFMFDKYTQFALLQSRVHESWTRFFASTLEDRLRYTPTDCFATFPFCSDGEGSLALEDVGRTYCEYRATIMIVRDEGLTRTYNRFHDFTERSADIVRLRDLHHAVDCAVLRAYGWHDLAAIAAPEFLAEPTETDYRYQNRLFWPAAFREEVLARLLDLNRIQAEAERRKGLTPRRTQDEEYEIA
ncbi:DNA methyltransferase [Falsiroseomonas sp. HC035]|uniref:DNA methyltransferase n=1 Tax=Falsiroseomonas sp. HC035 TaxID=3390999 RepID=UPI003D31846B